MSNEEVRVGEAGEAAEASIYFSPEGYDTGGQKLMGRHAAGEGFLRAWIDTHPTGKLACCVDIPGHARELLKIAQAVRADATVQWHGVGASRLPDGCGTIYLPGPGLEEQARRRAMHGGNAYSLCGVTHTISSERAQEGLRSLLTAPVHSWDAVVCTSRVVRSAVERLLDDETQRLKERLGATRFVRPLLPIIPLGVDTDRYRRRPEARADWRSRLGIGEDDLAFLFVGRLSFHAKAHPLPMFQALQRAARQLPGRRLHLILAGWFANDAIEQAFREGSRDFCPDVALHVVDARAEEARFSIWSAADVFLSLSDNYQETFGLTPLEAMAAELPVVATDWNGYRDTIPDGVVGYRIPTISAPPGSATDLAFQHLCGQLNYDHYSGHTCQFVGLDMGLCVDRIVALARSAELRRQLGTAGRDHARRLYDWRQIMAQYRALWREQADRRSAASPEEVGTIPREFFPDPCRLFQDYPTHTLSLASRLLRVGNPTAPLVACRQHSLLRYGMPSLLSDGPMAALLDAMDSERPTTVKELVGQVGLPVTPMLIRTLLWFVKVGLATVA